MLNYVLSTKDQKKQTVGYTMRPSAGGATTATDPLPSPNVASAATPCLLTLLPLSTHYAGLP